MKTEDIEEEIGQIIDMCDNYLTMAAIPVPLDATIHVDGLTRGLDRVKNRLSALLNEVNRDK